MNEELDRELMRLFAAANVPLEAEPFLARAEQRLRRVRRTRRAVRWSVAAVLVAFAFLVAPYLITASVGLNHQLVEFLVTPWGWGASVVAGAWIVMRARAGVRAH